MKRPHLLAIPLLVILAACAGWMHGATLEAYRGRVLRVAGSGPGAPRLSIESDYDTTVRRYVQQHGTPDYIHVINDNAVEVAYIDDDRLVVFQRGFFPDSHFSESQGIPSYLWSGFSTDDQQRLAGVRWRRTGREPSGQLPASAAGGEAARTRDAYAIEAERWRAREAGGGKVGGGGQLVGLDFLAYRQAVINAVKGQWTNAFARPGLVAKMRFEIAADGTVSDVRLEQSSGNSAYDLSAIQAVQRANPLPPPPTRYASEFREFLIELRSEEAGGQGAETTTRPSDPRDPDCLYSADGVLIKCSKKPWASPSAQSPYYPGYTETITGAPVPTTTLPGAESRKETKRDKDARDRSAREEPAPREPSAPARVASGLPVRWEGTLAARVKRAGAEVRLREAPSPFAAEFQRLKPGTPLLARERKGDWVAVTIGDGQRGFVPAGDLEVP